MRDESLIEALGVSVAFNGVLALEEVTLEINRGDYLGIVGPSGSGKTTLLKLLAGALRPSAGSIRRSPGSRIGYIPQVDSVDWNFPVSVLDVVLMARHKRAAPWSSRADRSRAAEILGQLGLGPVSGRQIRELSGGQQQRVFIARALMGLPQILLMDEPTSGVDVATRHDVLHLLHDLNHDEDIAVVVTTHDLNGIAAHMHDIICLNHRVIAAGPPAAILNAEVLERTYGAPMDVLSHGGMPVVVEHADGPHHPH